jgi:hypothetical protein
MSNLRTLEKELFESLFGMHTGYVLDFSNRTFATFFRETANRDIYDAQYEFNGNSKANRLRAFWQVEDDALVGKVLGELLEYWVYKNLDPTADDKAGLERCRAIVAKLLGRPITQGDSEGQFLSRDLSGVSLSNVKIDQSLLSILESRFAEAQRCMQADAPLSTIFVIDYRRFGKSRVLALGC